MSPRTISELVTARATDTAHRRDDRQRRAAGARAAGCPALPVVDARERFAGVFGEREFMTALFPGYLDQLKGAAFLRRSLDEALEKRDACRDRARRQHMNTEHVDVAPDYSDTQVAEIFLHHRVLIVPVVDDGRVVGLITRSDFFRALAERFLGDDARARSRPLWSSCTRRRRAARPARGDGGRAGVGQPPLAELRRRSGRGARAAGPPPLGQRRPDGVLLLRRRAGDPARARRRASCDRGGGAAGDRRGRRGGAPIVIFVALDRRRRGAEAGRSRGDRHRVRGRAARAARRPRVSGRAPLPAPLAIVDDIVAIAIIAIFSADAVSLGWRAAAAVLASRSASRWRRGCSPLGPRALGGGARVRRARDDRRRCARPADGGGPRRARRARAAPVSAFVVVPLFALANAGVDFGGGVLGDALQQADVGDRRRARGRQAARDCGATSRAAMRAGARCRGDAARSSPGVAAHGRDRLHRLAVHRRARLRRRGARNRAKVGIFAGSLVSGMLGAALLARRGAR